MKAAADDWKQSDVLAFDTEFVRERTFFPRLGLIQVCDGRAAFLIDPLSIEDLSPLGDILRAPGILKVLHSASEDVEVFWRALGVVPSPLLDTQIAAGLAGLAPSLGYQKLTLAVLGIEICKGETRTNWLARPLSPEQLAYAVEDVTCLLSAYRVLRQRLEELGRFEWALEDSMEVVDTERFEERPLEAYRRLRAAGRLTPPQLGVLRALAAWRDTEARRRDIPRSFVVKDDALVALAQRQPKDAEELARVKDLDPRQAKRDGDSFLELIRAALQQPAADLPAAPTAALSTPAGRDLERRLRETARKRAEELGMAPEVLVTRRPIEALVRSTLLDRRPQLPEELAGWRLPVIGQALLDDAKEAAAHGGDL